MCYMSVEFNMPHHADVCWHGGDVGIQMEGLNGASVNSQLKLFPERVMLMLVTQK